VLIDGRSLAEGEILETVVCVVGSGPAGLVVATELARAGVGATVVETGDRDRTDWAQELAAAGAADGSFQRLVGSRRRQLGGNANVWEIRFDGKGGGVRHLPLDEVDFEERAWLPHSGWPFGRSTLEPYYERAQVVCGLGPFRYGAEAWAEEGLQPLPLDPSVVRTAVFQVGRASLFTRTYLDELARSPTARILTNLTVVELETESEAGRVRAARARRPDGTAVAIRARAFVLAAGGVENPRLLLVSRAARPAGLGNDHDLVGRFFMEHPFVRGGVLVPHDRSTIGAARLYDLRPRDGGVGVMGHLALAADVRRRERLLGVGAVLFPRRTRLSLDALESLRALRRRPDTRRPLREPLRHARRLLRDLPSVPPVVYARLRHHELYLSSFNRAGWSRRPELVDRLDCFEVALVTEQAPDPENRITLGEERDALGVPRAVVSTRWGAEERRTVRRTRDLLAAEVARAGIGTLAGEGDELHVGSPTAHHHIGTTRMAGDPRAGVVDPDCRVHGVENLFVAGSSVFPTGGYANPTLTMIALALRLAEHLRTKRL
jgi:choline dehydrogenase-like flavoprotein